MIKRGRIQHESNTVTKEFSNMTAPIRILSRRRSPIAMGGSIARRLALLTALLSAAFLLVASPAFAVSPPKWKLTVAPNADYFLSGQQPGVYKIEAENIGEESTTGEITLEDVIPTGATAEAVRFYDMEIPGFDLSGLLCASTVECTFPNSELAEGGHDSVSPGQRLVMFVLVRVPSGFEGSLVDVAKISGGGADPVEATVANAASESPPFGAILHFGSSLADSSSNPYTQAGGHPYQFVTDFNFETFSSVPGANYPWQAAGTSPVGDPKDITSDLPPGLIANPQAVPHCPLADYFTQECETRKVAVGLAGVRLIGYTEGGIRDLEPILNLQPEGSYPGELGITVAGLPIIVITTGVRSGSDYGVTATSLAAQYDVTRVRLTLWGVPADESHNALRGIRCSGPTLAGEVQFSSAETIERNCAETEEALGHGAPAGVPPTPFFTMPTECSGNPLTIVGRYDTWQAPGQFAQDGVTLPPVDGCNILSFEPTIEARPTTDLADAPSGLEFNLHVPQNEDPEGVATPELKEAVVKLPKGLTLNPASGEGLTGCTEAQIGLHTEEPPHCPEASRLGSVEVDSPLLNEPLGAHETGSLFLAMPYQNPSGSLLAGYLAFEGSGIRFKLPGRFETNPQTGQITTKFLQNPQLPFEDLKLDIFGGARGALRTPAVCDTYETTSVLTPYSAPESGPAAEPKAEFETSAGPTGGACANSAADLPNAPVFHAGTESPQAGIYSPFSLKLVREDGSQEVKGIETTLPPGLVGRLAGISYCPDAALAAAANKSGVAERQSPSCPASSEVGTVNVASGAGPTPLNVPGYAYLAGPYKSAPLSLAIITPAVAGPFDLGTVVVRTALYVNPETAQITAKSDPIPTILEGIPLDVRSITLKMARPNFTLNPTNCNELGITGSALTVFGQSAPLTQRFQVGGCNALKFKPGLKLSLKGGTKRHQFPALKAVLTYPQKGAYANIASAQVTLPHSAFLEQGHIKTVCTRPQLASQTCPAASVYGHATAVSPLLDKPLSGPVYLGVGFGHKLPDLVAELNGQIRVLLNGKVDTGRGGSLRNSFEVVPDTPISKFTLSMDGGKKGLIVNSENLCSAGAKTKALATFTAQNGKLAEFEPTVANSCKKKGKKHGKSHKRASRRLGTSHR